MTAATAPEEGNVSVVVRVRPPNTREQEGSQFHIVQVVDHSLLVFDPDEPETSGVFSNLRGHEGTRRKGKDLKFIFDRVFGERSCQQEVFEHTTKPIIDGVLNGYNCSVFAYGATGAGKTHTMLGSQADPGVMYLTMVELYQRIEAIKEEKSCEVLISYLEVYNEQIQDLLEPKGFLAIREDPQKRVVVQGLSFHQPKSAEQLLQMLANGNLNRTQHPTDANASSSRSHAVFQIYVKQQNRRASITQDIRVAKMSLIDLAGSERASATNATGKRLREGANINRSLLALINVINALADAKSKKAHIPYRDSKLTRLLKDSIGGNCRTVMIAAVSLSSLSYDDTYNTLKYANRAKEIKLSLKSNVINLDCHISKYAAVCEELKAEVAELKAKLSSYENKETTMEETDSLPLSDSLEQMKSPRLEEPLDTSSPQWESKTNLQSLSKLTSGRLHRKQHRKKNENQNSKSDSFKTESGEENSLSIHLDPQSCNTERLVRALLHVACKQYAVLKQANLNTPEMDAEVQALALLAAGSRTPSDVTRSEKEEKTKGDSNKSLRVDSQLPSKEDIIPKIKEEPPIAEAPPTRRRQPTKRSREELLTDVSPTFRSPVVPMKRRKQANTPCKPEKVQPSTPEIQVKRPRKSSIPSRSNLRSHVNTVPNKPSESVLARQSKPFSPCTSRNASKIAPNPISQAVRAKGRMPLGTSALQNNASTPAPVVRDMNTTFDLTEEAWLVSEMDKTITFGPSKFPGWENTGVPQIDCTFVKSSDVPIFTTNDISTKAPNAAAVAPRPTSYAQRRRRSISSSSSRVGSRTASQSRIGRLQPSTTKRQQQPPTIPEYVFCSPRDMSTKKPGRATGAFGRSFGVAPVTRLMQLAAARS